MSASEKELAKWWLKYLGDVASELSEGEMNLLISFEDQFKRSSKLTPKQMEVLEDIYKRY